MFYALFSKETCEQLNCLFNWPEYPLGLQKQSGSTHPVTIVFDSWFWSLPLANYHKIEALSLSSGACSTCCYLLLSCVFRFPYLMFLFFFLSPEIKRSWIWKRNAEGKSPGSWGVCCKSCRIRRLEIALCSFDSKRSLVHGSLTDCSSSFKILISMACSLFLVIQA